MSIIGVGSNFMVVRPRSRKGVGQPVRVAHSDLGGSEGMLPQENFEN